PLAPIPGMTKAPATLDSHADLPRRARREPETPSDRARASSRGPRGGLFLFQEVQNRDARQNAQKIGDREPRDELRVERLLHAESRARLHVGAEQSGTRIAARNVGRGRTRAVVERFERRARSR